MLFVPANSQEKLAKISGFGSLPCIIDLEDSVALDSKASARRAAAERISTSTAAERLWVRVNALASGLADADIAAVARPGLQGIVVPKVEEADQLRDLDALLCEAERQIGLEEGSLRLIATIENVLGLANARAIASAVPRLERLGFGAADFSRDIGLDWPDPLGLSPTLEAAKVEVVVASRLAGLLPPDDGAYARFRDGEGLRVEAEHSKHLGFAGKHAIHPDQIPIIEAVFRPSEQALDRARRIIEAFRRAEATGSAAVGLDGEMIDYPVVYRAMELLGLEKPGDGKVSPVE